MRDKFAITELCDALDVSRSGYHASRTREPGRRDTANRKLIEHMQAIHAHRHTRSYGSPRMTRELKGEGMACSEKRVARLMRASGLRGRPRRPFRPKTTRPDHAACPSPNLLKAAAPPERPGQQLVSDITYIPTRQGWLYLAVIIDLFSRAVIGWSISDSLHTETVTAALRRAFRGGGIAAGALFHSDRGCQYTAKSTRGLLARHGLIQSMSAAGYCYDNAFAESFFASLKAEMPGGDCPFETKESARLAVFDYIETFYNRRRRHSSLDYLSPADFLKRHFQKQNQRLN